MTITKNVLKFYDISLDKRMQFGTISQQPTANSQQPTANSQQPTSNFYSNNFIFRYIYFAYKSSLGFFPSALFLCLIGSSTTLTDRLRHALLDVFG